MTIKPHLFYSSLIHFFLIAYILSIPIYKGSLYSTSFGPYSVDLVSEGKPPTKVRISLRAPQAKTAPYPKQQTAFTKAEEPPSLEAPSAVDTAKAEERVAEPADQGDREPEGITLLPEEPEKHTIIAKAEPLPVIEHKPEPEKKPEPPKPEPPKVEPPKVEPIVLPPPPETKPEPEVVVRELSLPKEPETPKPVEIKPSKVDTIEEPVRSEIPVKPDEKATEISPLTRTERKAEPEKTIDTKSEIASDIRTSEKESRTSENKTDNLTERETTTARTSAGAANITLAEKGISAGAKKGEKKTGQKSATALTGKSSVRKSGKDVRPIESVEAASSVLSGAGNGSSGAREEPVTAETGKGLIAGIPAPETGKAKEPQQRKLPLGIAVSDALFYRDVKIEVFLDNATPLTIAAKLHRKPHPSIEEYRRREQTPVALSEELEAEGKIIFSVAKAEKGIYTFVMQNTGERLQKTSLIFRLLEGKKGARNRIIENVSLSPDAKVTVKFILPEAIFWDDESYFTGSIESSESLTKFNDATGIVWEEDKE